MRRLSGGFAAERFPSWKRYDGTAGVSHSVRYRGEIEKGSNRIKGIWRIEGSGSGRFRMSR